MDHDSFRTARLPRMAKNAWFANVRLALSPASALHAPIPKGGARFSQDESLRGFEPRLTDSESVVLPLDERAIKVGEFTRCWALRQIRSGSSAGRRRGVSGLGKKQPRKPRKCFPTYWLCPTRSSRRKSRRRV